MFYNYEKISMKKSQKRIFISNLIVSVVFISLAVLVSIFGQVQIASKNNVRYIGMFDVFFLPIFLGFLILNVVYFSNCYIWFRLLNLKFQLNSDDENFVCFWQIISASVFVFTNCLGFYYLNIPLIEEENLNQKEDTIRNIQSHISSIYIGFNMILVFIFLVFVIFTITSDLIFILLVFSGLFVILSTLFFINEFYTSVYFIMFYLLMLNISTILVYTFKISFILLFFFFCLVFFAFFYYRNNIENIIQSPHIIRFKPIRKIL